MICNTYLGAAALGAKIYFAPRNQNNVGVLNTDDNTFDTIPISVTGNYKYDGAAALGTKIYFAPCYQPNVGVLETVDNSFLPSFPSSRLAHDARCDVKKTP